MRVERALPPNYAEIRERLNPPANAVFAWGDVIYAPSGADLPADLIVHETVHARQQAAIGGPAVWWRRYLDDPAFRLEQEVEAYRAQWAHVQGRSRSERRAILAHICRSLASGMYGRLVTKDRARALIVEQQSSTEIEEEAA